MRFAHIAALGCCTLLPAFASIGCSDTPPPLAKAGYTVEFTQGDASACNLQPHNADVGKVTATDSKGVIVDGTDGASIECEVSGSGTFSVTASIASKGNSLHIVIPKISTKATMDAPATGNVAFASPNTHGTSFASQAAKPCKFWFEGGNQTIATGKMWASFECDEVAQAQNICGLDQGAVVIENCTTGATEE